MNYPHGKLRGIHWHRKLTGILKPVMPEQSLVPCILHLLLPLNEVVVMLKMNKSAH